MRVVGRTLDGLGQQRERTNRGLQLVTDVGDEVATDRVDPAKCGVVVGEDQREVVEGSQSDYRG